MNKLLIPFVMSAIALVACGESTQTQEPIKAIESAPGAQADAAALPSGPEENVLIVYNWADYIPEGMQAAFEKETGIKVTYETFPTNEVLQAKLETGDSGYDIVVPGSVFAKSQIEADLLQPLDKSKIPNLTNLDSVIMNTLAKADPGNKYLVPWAWGYTTVGINKTKVEQALAGMSMPENAWDLVFKPEYTSKLKSCGISYLDSPTEVMPVALHYLGKDPYSNDPADYKAGMDMLSKVSKDMTFSSNVIDDMSEGKACVFVGWAGDVNMASDRLKANGSKDEIEVLLPSTGALIFFDTMAIAKNAKHPNNAAKFIDFYLRAENSARMTNEMNYPTANKAAINMIKPEIATNKTVFLEDNYFSKMISPGSFSQESREALETVFNTIKKHK